MNETELRETAKELNIEVNDTMGEGKLIEEIFSEKCESHYIQPTFIIDYPKSISPLTKDIELKKILLKDLNYLLMEKNWLMHIQN